MSQTQAESLIRSIILELVHRSASLGHEVSETLAAFMIKAAVLDPKNGFDTDRALTSQDVHKLKEICLLRLTEKCSPFLETVKMQVYFDLNYTARREFVAKIHHMVESKLSPLSREITDARVKTRDEAEILYAKITHYMLLRSGMGTLSDTNAHYQTTAALQSVFPKTNLGSFMALLKKDKEKQLKDLSMLVTGVLIFNRVSVSEDNVEVNVQDLVPKVLKEVIPSSSTVLTRELEDCDRLVWKFTSALEALTEPGTRASEERGVSVEVLRQVLYNARQHQAFLNVLMADVRASLERVEHQQQEMMTPIQELSGTVQPKKATPSAQVYPLFRSLSRLWSALQDEAELLHIFQDLASSLRLFTEAQALLLPELSVDELLQGAEVKSDTDRMSLSAEMPVDPAAVSGPDTEWLSPENTSEADVHSVQYSGFCGHALTSRDGLLLPGSPQLGLLKYKEKLYAFSSRDAALQFASAPERYISLVAERAKQNPELIQLLRLHRQFSCVTPYTELQSGEHLLVQAITHNSCSIQTDTHPVESNIDPTYEWNEWALRRKALKLADLRTKKTHSTQTDLSNFRRDGLTQTYPSRAAASQTMRDGESSVPQPLVYLSGLRGQRVAPVVKVDLTRAVDE